MSEALRYNQGKKDWSLLDCYFQDAQEAELECREYGVKKYTLPEKGIDGKTNWASSMGGVGHDAFMLGCLESANRHLLALRRGEQIDPESGKPHVGFIRLNMGMYLAYFNHKTEWPTPEVKEYELGTKVEKNFTSIKAESSWDDAPEWAWWRAVDEDGCVCWYELEPEIEDGEWYTFASHKVSHKIDNYEGDWRQSLEARAVK